VSLRPLALVLAGLFGLLMFPHQLAPQTLFERLAMPGPLSAAHAKLETTCTACHQAFSKEGQSPLCLGCHKDVAADTAAQSGFHGRSPAVTRTQCRHCHTEHQGREATISFFDPNLFDHSLTNFALTGGHVGVQCAACHDPGRTFRIPSSTCSDCHAKDDPHKGELGAKCANCHNPASWQKTTPWPHVLWPLLGAHAKTACHACHAGPRFVGLPKTCIGCHKQDDVHRAKLGPQCATCHKPTRWGDLITAGSPG
jgi:Cytochrome c3